MHAEDYRESSRKLGEIIDTAVAVDAAGTKTLERLHQLMQVGYAPNLDIDFPGSLFLHHPAKNFRHNLIFLYPDGRIVSSRAKEGDDEYCLYRDDDDGFRRFLRKVPRPTIWDKMRESAPAFLAWLIIGVVGVGLLFAVAATLRFLGFK
jgi:hypothetical protein